MIKAIETRYKGYRFRSRLEARWAVFFDALGIEWEYEKEGYDLGDDDGWYLPDFWLPSFSTFAEVKPSVFSEIEYMKCDVLSVLSGNNFLLLDGVPDSFLYFGFSAWRGLDDDGVFSAYNVSDDSSFQFGVMYTSYLSYHKYGRDIGYILSPRNNKTEFYGSDCGTELMGDSFPPDDMRRAIEAARAARFEFGEQG